MKARLIGTLLPDPVVKGVDRLLRPKGPHRFVEDLASELPIEGEVVLTVVKQRVGQRALLRIDDVSRGVRYYAKLTRRSREAVALSSEFLTQVAEEAERCDVRVPKPLVFLQRYRATVYEAVNGRSPLPCCAPDQTDHVRDDNEEPDALFRNRIFPRIGHALATLHRQLPESAIVKGRTFEREQVDRARRSLLEHRGDLRERFDQAVLHWYEAVNDLKGENRSTFATLHGDFYPAQVLIDQPSDSSAELIAILDWDNLCAGEAERDVSNFSVHIDLERLRGHLTEGDARSLEERFLRSYVRVRQLDPAVLAWYRQGTFLRLAALYANPEFGPSPPNDDRLPLALISAA